jgi:hypothetical protein
MCLYVSFDLDRSITASFTGLQHSALKQKRHRIRVARYMDKRERSVLHLNFMAWRQRLRNNERNTQILQRRRAMQMTRMLAETFQHWAQVSVEPSSDRKDRDMNSQLIEFVEKQRVSTLRRLLLRCRSGLTQHGWNKLVAFTEYKRTHDLRLRSASRFLAKVTLILPLVWFCLLLFVCVNLGWLLFFSFQSKNERTNK